MQVQRHTLFEWADGSARWPHLKRYRRDIWTPDTSMPAEYSSLSKSPLWAYWCPAKYECLWAKQLRAWGTIFGYQIYQFVELLRHQNLLLYSPVGLSRNCQSSWNKSQQIERVEPEVNKYHLNATWNCRIAMTPTDPQEPTTMSVQCIPTSSYGQQLTSPTSNKSQESGFSQFSSQRNNRSISQVSLVCIIHVHVSNRNGGSQHEIKRTATNWEQL